jgi:hypothetical protein
MNKIIFQIGLLLFFVSIVLFSMSGGEILDVVMRAFIVFIGATGVMGLVGFLSLIFSQQARNQRDHHNGPQVSETKAS